MRQGHAVRNVAELVDRIPSDPQPPDTFTPAELQKVLDYVDGDRYAIAWQLALTGLRRGEVAGLRWSDIDLDARTLQISSTRLRFGKHLVEDTPKSRAGRRTLPIPDHLAAALRTARAIQAADRLALGEVLRSERLRGCRRSRRGTQSACLDVAMGASAKSRRCPPYPLPRRPAYVRDAHASAGRTDRSDLRVARTRIEGVHDGDLRAFAARCAEYRGAEFRASCDKP